MWAAGRLPTLQQGPGGATRAQPWPACGRGCRGCAEAVPRPRSRRGWRLGKQATAREAWGRAPEVRDRAALVVCFQGQGPREESAWRVRSLAKVTGRRSASTEWSTVPGVSSGWGPSVKRCSPDGHQTSSGWGGCPRHRRKAESGRRDFLREETGSLASWKPASRWFRGREAEVK